MDARNGRIVFYSVFGTGLAAMLFFGTAIWRRWIDEELALLLMSLTWAVTLLLRWTVLRRYAPRWLGGTKGPAGPAAAQRDGRVGR